MRREGFEAFVKAEGPALSRLAWLLTQDRDTAADLLQTALEKAYANWPRVERAADPLAYVRRILANAATDSARMARRRPREVSLELPDRSPAPADVATADTRVEDRAQLRALLTSLPARQRTVLVLRYYADLSEADTAALLGISQGAVKSHAARALTSLRAKEASRD